MRIAFIDGQVIIWPKGNTIDDVVVIEEQEGGLYKLKGHLEQALIHVEPNELWHRRLAHVHYRALPIAKQSCWRFSRISSYLKGRTTWSGKRSGEECRSGDDHLEWPPRIVEFIHSRNVFQKEVITFRRLREEEEARIIRREEKMGATEDQALSIQRRSLKQWGIWRTQLLKNFLSTSAFG